MKQEKFVKFFKAGTWKNTICIFFLSVIICSMMYSLVNPFVDHLMPTKSITLTVNDTDRASNEIWICEDTAGNNLFSSCVSAVDSSMWEYRDAEEYQYSANTLLSYGDNEGATLTITSPVKSNSYLMFWRHMGCGEVTIDVDGKEYIVDTQSEAGDYYRFYPFQDSYLPFIASAIVYVILIAAAFCVLLGAYHYFANRKKPCVLSKYEFKLWYIFPLWLILFLYAVVQYKMGIPNYLAFGDQVYYWVVDLFKHNTWNPFTTEWAEYFVASSTLGFRGYWCNIFPSLAQTAGNWFHLDPVYFYLLAPSAAIAWLTGYVLPEMYLLANKKRASVLHVLTSLILILFFWNGILTAVLVDVFSTTFYLAGLIYAIKAIQQRKLWAAFASGVFISIACNFRTTYQYSIYLFAFVYVIYKIRHYLKTKTETTGLQAVLKKEKCVIKSICLMIVGFALIAYPQYLINLAREGEGFLPYDYEGSWVKDTDPADTTLMESHANDALKTAYSGYPIPASDDQMLTMKDSKFEHADFLQIPQVLDTYANSPLESMQVILKKLLVAFDVKTNVSYPNGVNWRAGTGMIFSFLNYFVLISAVYILIISKRVKEIEKALLAVIMLGLVLPQMIMVIEWRYILPAYFILYYIFSYYFTPGFVISGVGEERDTNQGNNYLVLLSVGILAYFTLSFMVYS